MTVHVTHDATLYVVLSRWTGVGSEAAPYRIEVAAHYPGASVADLVGHSRVPTLPNVALARVLADPATGAALEADARYDGLILWRWSPARTGGFERFELLDEVALARLRAGLQRVGLTAPHAVALAGVAEGRTRAEVCEAIIGRARVLASAR